MVPADWLSDWPACWAAPAAKRFPFDAVIPPILSDFGANWLLSAEACPDLSQCEMDVGVTPPLSSAAASFF